MAKHEKNSLSYARVGVTYDGVSYIQFPKREDRIHVGCYEDAAEIVRRWNAARPVEPEYIKAKDARIAELEAQVKELKRVMSTWSSCDD